MTRSTAVMLLTGALRQSILAMHAIVVLVHIQIAEGRATEFEEYEQEALQMIQDFGGSLLYRLRPTRQSDSLVVDSNDSSQNSARRIHETHVLQFPDYESLQSYRQSDELASLQSLREAAIVRTWVQVCTPIALRPLSNHKQNSK